MIYKVIRRFTDEDGNHYRAGEYVEIKEPKKLRLRIRRRDLLLARDQKGAKRLLGKRFASQIEEPKKQVVVKKEAKNVKKTKKQKSSVS